jgi:anti-sigma-K factor RskA
MTAMNNDDTSTTRNTTTLVSESAERDLDRMLDLVAAPAPSETLRARLLRDFRPGGAEAGQGTAGNAGFARARFGAVAVAAALVLAVALGITARPGGAPAPVAVTAPSAPASPVAVVTLDDATDDLLTAYEDGDGLGEESDESSTGAAERTFAEGAPDSAAFMLAALDLGLRANDPVSDDTGSFEGMPLE